MRPTILIGDIHGCLTELETLWDLLHPDADSRIIFLGDIIDRGPDSCGVVDFIQKRLHEYPESVLLMGNHEAKAIRQARKGISSAVDLTPDHFDFLEKALPYYAFEEGKFLALHGGIPPAFWLTTPHLPPLQERPQWAPKIQEMVEKFMYCRYVNPLGQMVPLGQQTPEDHFWADIYDGRAGTIFFGHQPFFEGPTLFPHAINLDTGCAFGGKLTAARIDREGRISFTSVAAEDTYSPYIDYGSWIADRKPEDLKLRHLSFCHS